jgi:hypothetical protein
MNDEPEQQPAAIDRRSASQPSLQRVAVAKPFLPASYAQPPQPPPALRSAHTNGRREDRLRNAMTRPRKTIATAKGTITGPIHRAEPKRPAGVSARQWKRQKMMYVRGTK